MSRNKQSKNEQRAEASKNLKSLQEAVKVQETDNAQTVAPVTSAPEVTSASVTPNTPAETIAPDPDLKHNVPEFTAGDKIRFFCMKCKAAKSTTIDEIYPTAQGHKRAKGICPTCGKKVTRGHLDVTPKAV